VSLALFAPVANAAIIVNNGLAPPHPANVLMGSPGDVVHVQNVGCDITVADPCASPGAPTTVNISGYYYSASAHNSSTLYADGDAGVSAHDRAHLYMLGYYSSTHIYDEATVHGGGYIDGSLNLHDSSHLAGGGYAVTLRMLDNSSGFITGGFEATDIRTTGSVVIMKGGLIREALEVFLSSNVSILDGEIGEWYGGIYARDSSTVTMFDGLISASGEPALEVHDGAHITLYGGDIEDGFIDAHDSGTITLYGTDFTIDGLPVGYGPIGATTGMLAGTLDSGDAVRGNLFHRFESGQIILAAIPQPSTAILLASGLVALGMRSRATRRAQS